MKRLLFILPVCAALSLNIIAQVKTDSVSTHVSDSIYNEEEEDFQLGLDNLFGSSQYFDLDTINWNNKMINSGHFESGNWKDTAVIVLADSSARKYFSPPFINYLTCNFGWRRWIWHYGVDIKVLKGDTIRSAFDGIVRVTKYDKRGYGTVVVVRHPFGLETIYGHLSQELVLPNQKIKAGEAIGLGGNSGRSTGSHLHFEIRYYGEPVNPNDIIDFATYKLKHDTLILTYANFEYLAELRKMKWTTVRKGDTLGHIAIRCHTTVTKLCQLNHIKRTTILSIGRKLRYQ